MFSGATAFKAKYWCPDVNRGPPRWCQCIYSCPTSSTPPSPPSSVLTPITNENIKDAVKTCLFSNAGKYYVDGMCYESEYGVMPDWDVSKVTDMQSLFSGYSSFNGNITAWDVSSVTDMSNMFENANAFTQDLSDWDTSSLTRLYRIFYTSNANPKVANWDVSRVTSMSEVFSHAYSFNQDISSWDVSSVTTMYGCFTMQTNIIKT